MTMTRMIAKVTFKVDQASAASARPRTRTRTRLRRMPCRRLQDVVKNFWVRVPEGTPYCVAARVAVYTVNLRHSAADSFS